MDFPYSIYVWHAPSKPTDQQRWEEALRADHQRMAIYAAGLLYQAGVPHQGTVRARPVVKVVRYGITFHCFPDEHIVQLCEKQIAHWNEHPHEPKPPSLTRNKSEEIELAWHFPSNTTQHETAPVARIR